MFLFPKAGKARTQEFRMEEGQRGDMGEIRVLSGAEEKRPPFSDSQRTSS